jgi:hypothetical protein
MKMGLIYVECWDDKKTNEILSVNGKILIVDNHVTFNLLSRIELSFYRLIADNYVSDFWVLKLYTHNSLQYRSQLRISCKQGMH